MGREDSNAGQGGGQCDALSAQIQGAFFAVSNSGHLYPDPVHRRQLPRARSLFRISWLRICSCRRARPWEFRRRI